MVLLLDVREDSAYDVMEMTVCLAAIYGKNKGIVAIADKMFTSAPGILTVHEVNENNKITKLTKNSVAMMAGNVTNASSIITQLIDGISESDSIEEIANKAGSIYQMHYRKAIEDNALSRWGLSLEDFMDKQRNLDADLVSKLNRTIAEASLEVDMIIAGCDKNEPSIYIVSNPGTVNCLDSTGIAYVGSGSAHASLSAVDSHYQKSDDLGKTLYMAFKAKKKAEYDPNVGKYTSVCIINGSTKEFSDDEIKELNGLYQDSSKLVNDILIKASNKLGDKYDGSISTKKSK